MFCIFLVYTKIWVVLYFVNTSCYLQYQMWHIHYLSQIDGGWIIIEKCLVVVVWNAFYVLVVAIVHVRNKCVIGWGQWFPYDALQLKLQGKEKFTRNTILVEINKVVLNREVWRNTSSIYWDIYTDNVYFSDFRRKTKQEKSTS